MTVLALASFASSGVSGLVATSGSNAKTSKYISKQALHDNLVAASSHSLTRTFATGGSSSLSGSGVHTFTISNDVDVTSKILFTANLSNDATAALTTNDQWVNFAGLALLKTVEISVGSQVWETTNNEAMLMRMQLESTAAQFGNWAAGMGGGWGRPASGNGLAGYDSTTLQTLNGSATGSVPFSVGGYIPTSLGGPNQGTFVHAAAPYQNVTVKVSFPHANELHAVNSTIMDAAKTTCTDFALYTENAIMSEVERSLVSNHEFVMLHADTQYQRETVSTAKAHGATVIIDLSTFNTYSSHFGICASSKGSELGTNISVIESVEFFYNRQTMSVRPAALLAGAGMTSGMDMPGNTHYSPVAGGTLSSLPGSHVLVFKLGECPQQHIAGNPTNWQAGGDSINNMRFDNISCTIKLKPGAAGAGNIMEPGDYFTVCCFGQKATLYSEGSAVSFS